MMTVVLWWMLQFDEDDEEGSVVDMTNMSSVSN